MTVEERLEELSEEYEQDLRELQQQYDDYANLLIEKIEERGETVKFLKIAMPEKIADVRTLISMQNDLIESLENLLESRAVLPAGIKKIYESTAELIAMTGCVEIRLLKHLTKSNSYKYELINIPDFKDLGFK